MKQDTEQNANQGTQSRQSSDFYRGAYCKGGDFPEKEKFRFRTETGGKAVGNQGCNHTGNQGGIVHNPHTDYFHGKDGGGHRSSEQGRKGRAHTAHGHDMFILFIKAKQLSDFISDASAKLQGSAFPSGGASQQVGN